MFHIPTKKWKACFRIEPLTAIAYDHDDDHYDTFEEAVEAAKARLPKYDDAYAIYNYCVKGKIELVAIVSYDYRSEGILDFGPRVFVKQGLDERYLKPPDGEDYYEHSEARADE